MITPDDPGVLAALDKIADRAVAEHWKPTPERLDVAWAAAAEALCTPGATPTLHDLYKAARDAVTRHENAELSHHGISRSLGLTTMPAFASYWYQPPLSGWEEAVVERIALEQIWRGISHADRRVLAALAFADGDYQAAAELLGSSYAAFRTRLGRARAAFRELWHEGESPSRQWSCDRRVFRAGDDPDGKVTSVPVTRRMAARRRRALAGEGSDRAA